MSASLADYFWSRVDKREPDRCWEWMAGRSRYGYGAVSRKNDAGCVASRVAYWLAFGPFDRTLHVLHHCDNPPCCNPAHLFLGTHAQNMADKTRKGRGRQPRGERHGLAKLTESDVRAIRTSNGTLRVIAAQYGVDHALIARIRSRKIWSHVADHVSDGQSAHDVRSPLLTECAAPTSEAR